MAKGRLIKFLNRPLVKGVLKSVPFVGDIVDNLEAESFEAPKGTLDKNRLALQLIRLAILVGVLYLVFSGKITMDQAEEAKDFLNN